MVFYIFNIVAPVFLVIGAGYFAVKRGLCADVMVDSLMKFAIHFAIPCLLFRATSSIDLATAFDWRVLLAFYVGASSSFALGTFIAWKVFARSPGEAVAVGFGALFSNLVLLGLPISERAWGIDTMATNYAIVSIHAPFCYLLGISTMEILRADGRSLPATLRVISTAMLRNSLMIAIGLGFMVNLSGLPLPEVVTAAVDIVSKAALPTALFAMGGILTRYSMTHAIGEISTISFLSLVIHPSLSLLLCYLLDVPEQVTRSVVLMAAMAPGANTYIFANMYQRGQGTAAGTVLLGTGVSILSVSAWLLVLAAL